MFPKSIRQVLSALERREFFKRFFMGLGFLSLTAVLLLFALYGLDRLLSPPWWMRVCLGLSALVGFISLARSHFWMPLRHRPTSLDLALRWERTHPELRDTLSTAVHFAEHPSDASIDFIQAVSKQAEKEAPQLKLKNAVCLRPARIRLAQGMIAGLLLLGSAQWAPQEHSIFWNRLIGNEIPWPSATQLQLLSIHLPGHEQSFAPQRISKGEYACALPKGSEPILRLRTLGKVPERASLILPQGSSDAKHKRNMKAAGGGLFRHQIPPLMHRTTFHFEAGDAPEGVPVLHLIPTEVPLVTDWLVHTQAPAYTKEPDETSPARAIRIPEGTSVSIQFRVVPPALSIWLQNQKEQTHLKPNESGLFSYSFIASQDGSLRVGLEGENHYITQSAAALHWEVLPDRPPNLGFLFPPRNWNLVPGGVIPLLIQAKDDYGCSELTLQSEAISSDESGLLFFERAVPDGVSKLQLKLSATDDALPPHQSEASSPLWAVHSPQSYEAHFADRMSHALRKLEQLTDQSLLLSEDPQTKAIRTLVQEMETLLGSLEFLAFERVCTPLDEHVSQTRANLMSRLQERMLRVGDIAQHHRQNPTHSSGLSATLLDAVLVLDGIYKNKAIPLREDAPNSKEAGVLCKEIHVELSELLETLLLWEDFQGAVDLLRELVRRQQMILLQTRELSGETP